MLLSCTGFTLEGYTLPPLQLQKGQLLGVGCDKFHFPRLWKAYRSIFLEGKPTPGLVFHEPFHAALA